MTSKQHRRWMRRNAWWRKAYAWWAGYFWLPCPLCGTKFAGFEWEDGAVIADPDYPAGSGRGRGICVACFKKGRADSQDKIGYMPLFPVREDG